MDTRQQLTLFPAGDTEVIETIRSLYNPLQFALIPAHVTLCREDELVQLERVLANCRALHWEQPLQIDFGKPVRFHEDKGVLLPATGDQPEFHRLRSEVLKGVVDRPRLHQPHLTLMHPRNSTCTDEYFNLIRTYPLPETLYFTSICLVEQENGGPWNVLETFRFHP